MTPLELYSALLEEYPNHLVDSICCVEKTCARNSFCADKQYYPVLDFDKVKEEYCRVNRLPTPKSVDAVCLGEKQTHFCFVELKGWSKYIESICKENDSDNKAQKPTDKVKKYELDKKLQDSQELCKRIVEDPDSFSTIRTVFFLVTDIDVRSHGIEYFADSLFTLSGTSSDIYSLCVSEARKTLDSEIHIDHYYVYCREFDSYLADL